MRPLSSKVARMMDRLIAAAMARPSWRRGVPSVLLTTLLLSAAAAVALRTSLVVPQPDDFSITIWQPLYRESYFWTLRPVGVTWSKAYLPRVELSYGYGLEHNAGPPGARSWIGRESVWIESTRLADDQGPSAERLHELLVELTPQILVDQRLVKRSVGITPQTPDRWWINWRGVGGWLSTLLAVVAAVLLTLNMILLLKTSRRRARIARGQCPRCLYDLRQLSAPVCPECGTKLTLHEQAILAAMRTGSSTHDAPIE